MSRNSEEPVFNQIGQIRTSMGLSRQELADLVGVHYQTIGYLERGEYSPSLVLALRIAKALKREVSELFSLTEQKKERSNDQEKQDLLVPWCDREGHQSPAN
jgi:DNA-binding XRE family transcriptional regulator